MSSLVDFPTNLTSTIVYGLFSTIILPLIINSILFSDDYLKKRKFTFFKKIRVYMLNIALSPILPLLLIQEHENNKAWRRKLILHQKNREKVLELYRNGAKTRKEFERFIRIDLGVEVYLQLSGMGDNFQLFYMTPLMESLEANLSVGGRISIFSKTRSKIYRCNSNKAAMVAHDLEGKLT